jgi:hypothetical protein
MTGKGNFFRHNPSLLKAWILSLGPRRCNPFLLHCATHCLEALRKYSFD